MNRFYQHPLSPAWTTARSRAALVEPSSKSRRYVVVSLHKSVIYGPAMRSLAGICRCRLLFLLVP